MLGRRGTGLLGVAGAVAVAAPTAVPLLSSRWAGGFGAPIGFPMGVGISIDSRVAPLADLLTYAAVTVLTLAAVAGVEPAIRRRVLTLVTPAAAILGGLLLILDPDFDTFVPALLRGTIGGMLLLAAPALMFVAGLVLVRRWEPAAR